MFLKLGFQIKLYHENMCFLKLTEIQSNAQKRAVIILPSNVKKKCVKLEESNSIIPN